MTAGCWLLAKGVALGLLKVMVVELQEKMNEDGDPRNPLTKDEFIDAAAIALKDHAQNAARDLQAIITAQNAKEDAMAHGMHRERHPSQYGNGGVPMGQPIPMGMNRGRGVMGMF